MYRVKPNGGKEQIRNNWLYRLFAKRPNDYQNPMEFRAMMMGHLALRGNAFAQRGTQPEALYNVAEQQGRENPADAHHGDAAAKLPRPCQMCRMQAGRIFSASKPLMQDRT